MQGSDAWTSEADSMREALFVLLGKDPAEPILCRQARSIWRDLDSTQASFWKESCGFLQVGQPDKEDKKDDGSFLYHSHAIALYVSVFSHNLRT